MAEQLCREALMKAIADTTVKPSQFLYLLAQIYETTNNSVELIATRRAILLKGDTDYFRKLKSLYEQLGILIVFFCAALAGRIRYGDINLLQLRGGNMYLVELMIWEYASKAFKIKNPEAIMW